MARHIGRTDSATMRSFRAGDVVVHTTSRVLIAGLGRGRCPTSCLTAGTGSSGCGRTLGHWFVLRSTPTDVHGWSWNALTRKRSLVQTQHRPPSIYAPEQRKSRSGAVSLARLLGPLIDQLSDQGPHFAPVRPPVVFVGVRGRSAGGCHFPGTEAVTRRNSAAPKQHSGAPRAPVW